MTVFVGLIAAAVCAASPGVRPGDSIRVTAKPEQITLGAGKTEVELTIRLPGVHQNPQLQLHSTAGRVRDLRKTAKPGVFTAKLMAPDEQFPQIAVITAADISPTFVGKPPTVGRAVVAYSAQLNLKGKSEPGARMRIVIDGDEFGPVRSDDSGRFNVPVLVRPGQGWAKGISTDTLGNTTRSKINLYLPQVQRIHSFAYPNTVVADGNDAAWIFVTTVNSSGAPQKRPLHPKVRHGRAEKVEQLASGTSRIRYIAPKGVPKTPESLQLRTDRREVQSAVPIQIVAGKPATISAVFAPQPAPADGSTETIVTLVVSDEYGSPTIENEVLLAYDGAAQTVEPNAQGRLQAKLPPRSQPGRSILQLLVNPRAPQCARPFKAVSGTVDFRGIPCENVTSTHPFNGVLAKPFSKEITAQWRKPTPVDLRLRLLSRKSKTLRLTLDATGIASLGDRITVTTSRGEVLINKAQTTQLTFSVELSSAKGPVDIVATDRESGVSAWLRVD